MQTVQVGGWLYPSFNATDGIAVELYLAGCNRKPKCDGCHNPEMWSFEYGETLKIGTVLDIIRCKYKKADNIVIMGGEPLHQSNLLLLLENIKNSFPDKLLWLYTSYELGEVPIDYCYYTDYLKTGRYDKSKRVKGRLASSNQKIWKNNLPGIQNTPIALKDFSLYFDPNWDKERL